MPFYRILFFAAIVLSTSLTANAQNLQSPYPFEIPEARTVSENLLGVPFEKAGARGRVVLTGDGHLGFADGTRLRVFGTNLQWAAQFPDSAGAIQMAQRFRALGINCVRFSTFDYPFWFGASVLGDGTTSLGSGLHPIQMQKLDWFLHQLREHGVYYVFTFHSVWQPREGDGVRQRDSIGWGSRMPLVFDPVVQAIHRGIMKMVLHHVNPYTSLAYKDDPALAYVIAAEDASLMAYWLYTGDVVRPNGTAPQYVGSAHVALVDSLWHVWLRKKYSTDGAIAAAWNTPSAINENLVRNGDFEDPFSAAWQLGVNQDGGAQAILQFSDAEKRSGSSGGRVRIGSLDDGRLVYGINLSQRLATLKKYARYTLTFWAKTTPQRGTRTMKAYVYNGTYPFDNYGVDRDVVLTAQWQKFSVTFTSRASDEATANVSFFMGADSGDVFLDDVELTGVATTGLRAGESLAQGTIARLNVLSDDVSVPRYRDNSLFHHEQLSLLFSNVKKMVRDTLKSQVLLCPSTRLTSFFDVSAVPDYDVYSATDWRNTARSVLTEVYGGSVGTSSQSRVKGKAFVMSHVGVAYPQVHQHEMAMFLPIYSGLQDWDGVLLSNWSDAPRSGADKVDSNAYWTIADKQQVTSVIPVMSTMMRRGDVATSQKEIVINNTRDDIEQPRYHAQQSFSLSLGADPRMACFRRVAVDPIPAELESVLPQREISALADQVDVSALDAENEQIFWNAATGSLRVSTPRTIVSMGMSAGAIVNVPGVIIEQVTEAPSASVVVTSLTDEPVLQSERCLMVVSTRGQNTGTQYDASAGTFTSWGRAPFLMEGVTMRVTFTAPGIDTLFVQPLDGTGLAVGKPEVVLPRTGQKFTALINTAGYGSPWCMLRFAKSTTSVKQVTDSDGVSVRPNITGAESVIVHHSGSAVRVYVVNVRGERVADMAATGEQTVLATAGLAPGAYVVCVTGADDVVRTSSLKIVP